MFLIKSVGSCGSAGRAVCVNVNKEARKTTEKSVNG